MSSEDPLEHQDSGEVDQQPLPKTPLKGILKTSQQNVDNSSSLKQSVKLDEESFFGVDSKDKDSKIANRRKTGYVRKEQVQELVGALDSQSEDDDPLSTSSKGPRTKTDDPGSSTSSLSSSGSSSSSSNSSVPLKSRPPGPLKAQSLKSTSQQTNTSPPPVQPQTEQTNTEDSEKRKSGCLIS